MSRVPPGAFWEEPRATKATPGATRLYPATASSRWYLSTDSADQAATLAVKNSRLFLDTAVTDGGRIALINGRVSPVVLPASTI